MCVCVCVCVFQPEVFWLCSPFYSYLSNLEPFHQVPGSSLVGTRLCSLHVLNEPSPLPDEGRCCFPILQLRCTEMDGWSIATKQQLLQLPAPSSPRQRGGYTDKPETTNPGSAKSQAVHAITLLRIPGHSRNRAASKSKLTM